MSYKSILFDGIIDLKTGFFVNAVFQLYFNTPLENGVVQNGERSCFILYKENARSYKIK